MGSRPNIQPPHIEQSSAFGEIGEKGDEKEDEELLDPMSRPAELIIDVWLMSAFNITVHFWRQ